MYVNHVHVWWYLSRSEKGIGSSGAGGTCGSNLATWVLDSGFLVEQESLLTNESLSVLSSALSKMKSGWLRGQVPHMLLLLTTGKTMTQTTGSQGQIMCAENFFTESFPLC